MYRMIGLCHVTARRLVLAVLCLLLVSSTSQAQSPSGVKQEAPSASQVPKTGFSRQHRSTLSALSNSLATLADRVSPAVVQVLVTGYGLDESDKTETALITRQHSLGSGVIVDPDGYIITNAHVVEGAQRIRVVFTNRTDSADGATRTAKRTILTANLVGAHKETDLALLKVEARGLPFLRLVEPLSTQVGEIVLAIGSPEGLQNSVTMGIVSSVARQPDPDQPMIFIQTDAPINPGNSGGPLVDAEGNLVGINTFILTQGGGSEGLGFAVPVRIVRFVYQQLRKRGHVHRSVIGATAQAITPALAKGLGLAQDWGVIVSDVSPDGPADAAGLAVGDIILTLDGKVMDSMPLLVTGLYLHPTDDILEMQVLRGSKRLNFGIPVMQEQDSFDRLSDKVDLGSSRIPRLGLIGLDVSDKLAELLPKLRIPSGVVVVAKTPRSAVIDTGLSPGDVIHFVNGKAVANLEQLSAEIRQFKTGDAVALQIERTGKLMYVAFEME